MMDKKLIEKLEPIEDEFDVNLFTFDEALDFVQSDMESILNGLDKAIEFSESNEDFVMGLSTAKGLVRAFMQNRIDEGY